MLKLHMAHVTHNVFCCILLLFKKYLDSRVTHTGERARVREREIEIEGEKDRDRQGAIFYLLA